MAPKKSKQEKMSLGNFLSDQTLGSWADEMEDQPLPSTGDSRSGYGSERRGFGSGPSFGGDRSSSTREYEDRGYSVREELPLPNKPPYTAHLGNLSFEVTNTDVESFFAGCEVTNVRIVEDKLDRKPKGFGYVEFASLDGLKQALTLSGTQFQGRNIRVSVAEPPKEREQTREFNDWTRKGPLPDAPNARRVSERGSFRGGYDAASDAGSERGPRRPFEGDGKSRDFGNWERKGPLTPSAPAAAEPRRQSGSMRGTERTFERRDSPSWGEGRPSESRGGDAPSQEGSRPPRPAPERVPTAADLDSQWRAKMKPDAPTPASPVPDASVPPSPSATTAPTPASRPRLNLQKRTVSEAPSDSPASASDSKASPFGAARPINTQAREQEIEQKRVALRQKKEQEDKAREEKKTAEKTAKAERGQAQGEQENAKNSKEAKGGKEPKENGATSPGSGGRKYEILQHMSAEEGGEIEEGEPDEAADGEIVDDKNVKPKEVVRDIGAGADGTQETTADSLEGDGWSTVPNKNTRGRRNNPGSRALAS